MLLLSGVFARFLHHLLARMWEANPYPAAV
jgi:hypothetical protein